MQKSVTKSVVKKDYSTHIRLVRDKIAYKLKIAPYMILGEQTLREMSLLKPTSIKQLQTINGVGEHFINKHGYLFLFEGKTRVKSKGKTKSKMDTNM